jgi:hypothetical protein
VSNEKRIVVGARVRVNFAEGIVVAKHRNMSWVFWDDWVFKKTGSKQAVWYTQDLERLPPDPKLNQKEPA